MTAVKEVMMNNNNKKYELVAPDGGWGYMICFAAVIIFIATVSFMPCFGLLFNDFLTEIGVSSTEVNVLNGINALCFAIGGYITSPLLKILTLRNLALIGAILFNMGSFLLLFCKSIVTFSICLGFLQGMGMGMLCNLTFTILNEYFVKRRLFAFSISQTVSGIFGMFAPKLIESSLREYGYRGTLLLLTAIGMQAFVGVSLFQPVARHMKKIQLPSVKVAEMEISLLNENVDDKIPTIKLSDTTDTVEKSSFVKTDIKGNDATKSGFIKVVKNLFDVSTTKLVVTSISSWAVAITMFGDFTVTIMLPQAFYAYQWHEKDVATAMSLAGFGDLAARIAFVLFSNSLNKVGNSELYIIGLLISTVGKFGMIFSKNINIVYVFMVLVGVGRCFAALLMPMVQGGLCPEKFSTVMGISLVFMGLTNLSLGPLVGVIRDFTDSYVITFFFLTVMNFIWIIIWTTQLVLRAIRKRRISSKQRVHI